MTTKQLKQYFELHCRKVIHLLKKDEMLSALKDGVCPFRCHYCKFRQIERDCKNCAVLELKEQPVFQECQELIRQNPKILKSLYSTLNNLSWREPNLRGGF